MKFYTRKIFAPSPIDDFLNVSKTRYDETDIQIGENVL